MPFQLTSQARYARVDTEGVLLLQQAGQVLVINELGLRIVELLEVAVGLDAVLDRLAVEFEVDRPTLEHDVSLFLEELAEAGALERC